MNYKHLTNKELIDQLTLLDELTALEHELLDRLIRAQDALRDLERDKDINPDQPDLDI